MCKVLNDVDWCMCVRINFCGMYGVVGRGCCMVV